jgi:hypothetical protein
MLGQTLANWDTLAQQHTDDILEEKALGTAIYGVMYTVCKEKTRYSWAFISCRLLFDWLQLWVG